MTLVHTTLGELPIDQLEIKDIIEIHDNARVLATEWRKDGELVRRDVHVSVLRGHDIFGDQSKVG